ncbi:MAG: hypothetical protein N2C12_07250 [Planctomycetales bacterium]
MAVRAVLKAARALTSKPSVLLAMVKDLNCPQATKSVAFLSGTIFIKRSVLAA